MVETNINQQPIEATTPIKKESRGKSFLNRILPTSAKKFIKSDKYSLQTKIKKGPIGTVVRRNKKGKIISRKEVIKSSGLKQLFALQILKKKKQLSPMEMQKLSRLQQLEKQKSIMNTEPKAVIGDYYERKRRMMLANQMKNNYLSPNTRLMLERTMAIQNKGAADNSRMQRIHRERKILSDATNILRTPFLFKNDKLDMTGIGVDNILLAPSVFAENPANTRILSKKKHTILTTREDGNNLKF